MRKSKVYIPWTLAAIRRVRRCDRQSNFNRNCKLVHIDRYLRFYRCALQWDTERGGLIVVPNSPRPYPDNR